MWASVHEWGTAAKGTYHDCNRLDRIMTDAKEEMDQRPGIEVGARIR